jgi:hypothetical protein
MFAIIFIAVYISVFLIGILFVILRGEQYEAELRFLLVVIIYFIGEMLYFITFNLSTEKIFDLFVSKFIFTISLICRIFSTALWSSSHSSELNKTSKVRFLPLILYLFLFGVISSLLLDPNSFDIMTSGENYIYNFNSFPLLVFLFLFYIFSLIILWITQIKGFKNFSDRDLAQFNNYYIILFSITTLLYIFYLVSMNEILRILHITFYLIAFLIIIYIIIKKPSLFLVYTNRIYDFIIFHKSGILLYSYNFQTGKEVDEKSLKGSILIGISHIMANLSNIENQLTYIKMKDKAIVFNFDKELGFAILLVAKHKNSILEKSINTFMIDFSLAHKEILKRLNGLIDISGFEDARDYINRHFKHYILK